MGGWGDDPSFPNPPKTSKGKGKAPAKGKVKWKAKKTTTLRRAGAKRRRLKKDDHEPDEAEMDGEVAPIAKKPRTRAKPPEPAVLPTRTLRPRKSKMAEEMGHNAAWKDAVGKESDESDA